MGLVEFVRSTIARISKQDVTKLEKPSDTVPSTNKINYHEQGTNHVNFGNSEVITRTFKRKKVKKFCLDDKRTDFYDGNELHGC